MKRNFIIAAGLLSLGLCGQAVTVGQTNRAADADSTAIPTSAVVDEVIWVVGDEPILRSDVEMMRAQAEMNGTKWDGDPDCAIPEQLAVQKLFLHQAALDSVEVSESEIAAGLDQQIAQWIQIAGSQEKLEEYRGQSVSEMRMQLHDEFRDQQMIRKMKQNLVKDVKVSPADVRRYFAEMPADSLPFVPTQVEVEIITHLPRIPQDEINRVKNELRNYTDRVNKGETTFATLARLYSEDTGTARQGGETGFTPRAQFVPEFSNVAFNLTDPKKISKIVETEFGFHIIQLVDRRGDRINVRHILLKPRVSQEDINAAMLRLDSIANDIRDNKFTFEAAASALSDDKDTRNNHGLMSFVNHEDGTITSRFRMQDLPTEIARVVDTMKVGEISKAFDMVNSRGKTQCAVVKLVKRIDGHRATITEDFQVMKDVVYAKTAEKTITDWVTDKIKHTYIRMKDEYKNCNFEYQGWIK